MLRASQPAWQPLAKLHVFASHPTPSAAPTQLLQYSLRNTTMDKKPIKRRKVLYLITKSNWGGAQRYVYDLATHLDRDCFEPVVALGGDGLLAEQLRHADIRIISIDSLERDISARKEWRTLQTLWRLIGEEQPDILHVNSSKSAGLGAFVGRIRRVPRIIFTAHGWAFNEDRPWWQRYIIKFFHWLTVLLAHRTIAVSSAIVKQMNWPGAQRSMKIIHPGRTIGVMFTHQEARAALTEYASGLESAQGRSYTWVGTIAELHPIKQLDVLIDALAILSPSHPKLRGVIIGDGGERAALQRRIAEHGLDDTVFLLGAVPEAARFLHALNYFVLPSRSEAYGYAVHEAGLARLPVVASDVGGIRDIVTHNESGILVPPGDPQAIATALETLLADHTLTERLRHNLHTSLHDRTLEKMSIATTALYTLPTS